MGCHGIWMVLSVINAWTMHPEDRWCLELHKGLRGEQERCGAKRCGTRGKGGRPKRAEICQENIYNNVSSKITYLLLSPYVISCCEPAISGDVL